MARPLSQRETHQSNHERQRVEVWPASGIMYTQRQCALLLSSVPPYHCLALHLYLYRPHSTVPSFVLPRVGLSPLPGLTFTLLHSSPPSFLSSLLTTNSHSSTTTTTITTSFLGWISAGASFYNRPILPLHSVSFLLLLLFPAVLCAAIHLVCLERLFSLFHHCVSVFWTIVSAGPRVLRLNYRRHLSLVGIFFVHHQ